MSFDGDLYPEAGASKVITTKGDLVRGNASGDRERYGIGSTNQILSVSSGNILWKTLTTADSVLTTQGDILYEGASGLARLGQSTDGFVLTTKGASADPVWAAAGGGKAVAIGSDSVTTGTSMSLTGLALPLATTYSSLQVNYSGITSGTRGTIGLKCNGSTNNNYDYIRQDAGTMEQGNAGSQATFELIDSSGSGSYYFGGSLVISQFQTGTTVWVSSLSAQQLDSSAYIGGYISNMDTNCEVTSIEILGSHNYTGYMVVSGIER